jgi:hypothetical protein
MEAKIVLKFGVKVGSTLTAICPIPASCAKKIDVITLAGNSTNADE